MSVNKVRRNGSYAPLSAHYYKDDAIDEAGEAAELLYVRGLAFCADILSDGFISDRQLVRFVGVGMTDAQDRAKKLAEVGLWQQVEGGYQVRSWLDWNRSRAEITDAQAKDAARKRGDSEPDNPPPTPPSGGREPSERNPSGVQPELGESPNGAAVGLQPRAGARARSLRNSTPRNGTTEQTPLLAPLASAPTAEKFEEFYAAYPRRQDRGAAERAWRTAVKAKVDPDHMIAAARRYAQEVRDTQRTFIKLPATWLNAAAYDNEPPAEDDPAITGERRVQM